MMKRQYIQPSVKVHAISFKPVMIGTSGDPLDANTSNQSKQVEIYFEEDDCE